jgi:MYXO-CTERM domain-containing protein
MDFIEKLFGLSPDDGDGSTELLWCVALAVVLVVAFYLRHRRRKPRHLFRR